MAYGVIILDSLSAMLYYLAPRDWGYRMVRACLFPFRVRVDRKCLYELTAGRTSSGGEPICEAWSGGLHLLDVQDFPWLDLAFYGGHFVPCR